MVSFIVLPMFKKSFVSIFFSSNRLQVLQLSASKKKVKKFASVELPQGLISNYRVADEKGLAKIVKGLWDQTKLQEKAVGLIVPEFSTFTKLFSLPKLDLTELDEAVRWQAEDFLPGKLSDMVADWKIVKSQKDSYQLLLAAMNKKILEGYVNSVVEAGLFPLVVEIPSLSLVRLSAQNSEGRLILYNNFGEGILVIAEGEKILGSSIVAAGQKDEIIETSSRIIAHYTQVDVKKVIIGGVNLDKGLAKELETKLNKQVETVNPGISGLTDDQVQEYLVPISLQLKEPAKPSDENTINLLPADLVNKYEGERFKLQIWSLTLTVTLFVWISFLATLGTYLFITNEEGSLRERNQTEQRLSNQRTGAVNQIKQINQISDRILKIKAVSISPVVVLDAISSAKPEGVVVSKYKMNLDKGEIGLEGIAQDRLSLIEFKQNMEGNPHISSVNIPVSSFEVESNLTFKLSFFYTLTNVKKNGT